MIDGGAGQGRREAQFPTPSSQPFRRFDARTKNSSIRYFIGVPEARTQRLRAEGRGTNERGALRAGIPDAQSLRPP